MEEDILSEEDFLSECDRDYLLRRFAAWQRRRLHELSGHVHGQPLRAPWLWTWRRKPHLPQRMLCSAASTAERYSLGGLMWLSASGRLDWSEATSPPTLTLSSPDLDPNPDQ